MKTINFTKYKQKIGNSYDSTHFKLRFYYYFCYEQTLFIDVSNTVLVQIQKQL